MSRRGELAARPYMRDGRVVTPWVNPLVCVCEDPKIGAWGECAECRRKPLRLFRVQAH